MNAPAPNIIPQDEARRMAAVTRYEILDTPADGAFDRITAIAARRFDVPIAIISIVDHDRIWFKSHHGLDVAEIGRDPGLCASAILSSDPHILTDASVDPRSLANPLVAGDFGLRFYAGVPLQTADGHNLGTLCVIDKAPRPVDQGQIDDLKDLAAVVVDQLELRLSARRALAQAELMAREIDHRVMNSLQFVSGLLTMQSRDPAVTDAAAQLQEAATRVAAVACVHRNFYSDETDEVSCLTFLGRLCADLSGICGRPVEVEGDEARVPTIWIQPIGLITNELVTNAAKHGAGKILVSYRVNGAAHALSVCDEGEGLPADFDPGQTKGLGMRVVTTLARQLGGQIEVTPIAGGRGSCISISFAV
ncbi:MAG TPA: histidine kinase dimerization/phosphoacceptor domain -containing protein [Allosphingosinicella sp.]|nr:histidine kinase dimerization/phosphoacceptor domain -containing protein [Allosphingosinicella sp.]